MDNQAFEKFTHISPSGNIYYLVRHTECVSNVKKISSYRWQEKDFLTDIGIEQAKEIGEKLQTIEIDLIFCSPFLRTRQTLEIINKSLLMDQKNIFFDDRLVENNFGITDELDYEEFHKLFSSENAYFETEVPGGENYADTQKRLANFLEDVESRFSNKAILIISHGFPLRMLELVSMRLDRQEAVEQLRISKFVNRGEIRSLKFSR